MAKITYEQGIKCSKCENIFTSMNKFQKTILCQGCGTYLGDFDLNKKELLLTKMQML